MNRKVLATGAEAIIIESKPNVIKKRISKGYRHPELDMKLRKRRTKAEAKILSKASSFISVPIIIKEKDFEIEMKKITGDKLSENLDKYSPVLLKKIFHQIGNSLAKLHDLGIVHGDLTTSNMIYNKKEDKVYFIDFGLGFHSNRIEDKSVDLRLLKQSLEAKHPLIYEKAFKEISLAYSKQSKKSKETLKRLKVVESRGRYKQQY